MRRWVITCLLSAGLCLPGVLAEGSTITDTVNFSASGFTAAFGGTPTDPVTGSFTITFDPTQSYSNETAGITLNNLNIPLGSSLAFSYEPTVSPLGPSTLIVGGVNSGAEFVTFFTDDFYFQIVNLVTSPEFRQFGYTTAGGLYFFTDVNSSTSSVSVSATPIPAALPLFASALGGLGLFGWRRRKAGAQTA